MRKGIVVAVAVVGVGCSSSNSSSSGGGAGGGGGNTVIPCQGSDAGLLPCQLDMPVTGALSTTLTSNGSCGYGGGGAAGVNSIQLGQSDFFPTEAGLLAGLDVEAYAANPPIPESQIGPVAVSIHILQNSPNGNHAIWATPAGACTLDVTTNICVPALNDYGLIGTGTCSQPAAPQSGSSTPITIGDFTFTAHIGTFQ